MRKNFNNIITILIGIVVISLISIPLYSYETTEAVNGVIDCEDFKNKSEWVTKISGRWEFYYNELLTYDEVKNRKADTYINVPDRISEYTDGKDFGYMTLHFKVKVPKDQMYGAYFNSLLTASDIYVNGERVGGHGRVGKSKSSEKPTYKPQALYFKSKNGEIDILIHTSVYREIKSRISYCYLGTQNKIIHMESKAKLEDGIAIGLLIMAAIVNFGVLAANPKKKRYLYFALLCVVMIIRTMVYNSRMISYLFDYVEYEVISKIAAITIYLFVMLYILFIDDIFDKRVKIKNMSIAFSIMMCIICLFTESKMYDSLQYMVQVIVGIFILYMTVFLIKENIRKHDHINAILFPYSVLVLCAINDMLVNNSIIYTNYMTIYGMVGVIMVQFSYVMIDYFNINQMAKMANIDSLTGVYNNRYIKNLIHDNINLYNIKFSIIMIDVDDFKNINDAYGHVFGDTVLRDVANVLKISGDKSTVVGRYGGDEFIAVLSESGEKEAKQYVMRVNKELEMMNQKYDIIDKVNLSIGIYENKSLLVDDCITEADRRMYASKRENKRNLVIQK